MSNQCHHIVTKVDDRWVEWRKEFHQGLGWVVKLMAPLDLKVCLFYFFQNIFDFIEVYFSSSVTFNENIIKN